MGTFQEFYNIYKSTATTPEKAKKEFSGVFTDTSDKIAPVKSDKCVVVIPAYSNNPTDFEKFNFMNNVAKIDEIYDICIVCPKLLKPSIYKDLVPSVTLQFLRLPSRNFIGKNSYSAMMLSPEFYSHFTAWQYMLILQLDAYIFGTSDELVQFVALDKPYIGAPWKKEYAATLDIPTETSGNGGVSLRRV